MMRLPIVHLTNFDPIEVKMHLGDRRKRLEHDCSRWQCGVALVARDRLLLLQELTP